MNTCDLCGRDWGEDGVNHLRLMPDNPVVSVGVGECCTGRTIHDLLMAVGDKLVGVATARTGEKDGGEFQPFRGPS